ncbi:MAG: hypothetical protein JWQ25_2284 [Daejeonella sp.]|nr:hypothetical protein [Daejeonella sp.]
MGRMYNVKLKQVCRTVYFTDCSNEVLPNDAGSKQQYEIIGNKKEGGFANNLLFTIKGTSNFIEKTF